MAGCMPGCGSTRRVGLWGLTKKAALICGSAHVVQTPRCRAANTGPVGASLLAKAMFLPAEIDADLPASSRASSLPQKIISIQIVILCLMRARLARDKGDEVYQINLGVLIAGKPRSHSLAQDSESLSNLPIRQRASGLFGVGQDADAFLGEEITHRVLEAWMRQVMP